MSTPTPETGVYHHGRLRETLLAHGIDLARAGGAEAVSIRAVQRLAGVSNAAAYRHYADRHQLLQAIADHAARAMAETMTAAITAVPEGPSPAASARARFRASGAAYLHFALVERGLFTVAFLDQLPSSDPEHPRPAARTAQGLGPFQLLQGCIADLHTTGVLADADVPYTDVAAWSAVHGLAVLLTDGPLTRLDDVARRHAITRLLDIVEHGLGDRHPT